MGWFSTDPLLTCFSLAFEFLAWKDFSHVATNIEFCDNMCVCMTTNYPKIMMMINSVILLFNDNDNDIKCFSIIVSGLANGWLGSLNLPILVNNL